MSDRVAQKPTVQLDDPQSIRIGIVRASFHSDVTAKQLKEAERCLQEHNVPYDVIDVPGCFELPYGLQQMAESMRYDGLIALGCLVKGETIHFEVISYAVGKAIMDLIMKYNLPIGFGVITTMTQAQAEARTWFGYDTAYSVLQQLQNTYKER